MRKKRKGKAEKRILFKALTRITPSHEKKGVTEVTGDAMNHRDWGIDPKECTNVALAQVRQQTLAQV